MCRFSNLLCLICLLADGKEPLKDPRPDKMDASKVIPAGNVYINDHKKQQQVHVFKARR